MKFISLILFFSLLLNEMMAVAQSGVLDSTFGNNGIGVIAFNDGVAYSVIIQPDGKIVAGGTSSNHHFALVRYNPDGLLDSTFGIDGKVETNIGNIPVYIAIQADGKILLSGSSYDKVYFNKYSFALLRFNANGTRDSSFGGDGLVTTYFNHVSNADYATGVAIQADGKIVQVGMGQADTSGQCFAVARFNTNGSLDNTFGIGGKVLTPMQNPISYGQSVALQPDGKILLGGYSESTQRTCFALARYNTDGSLDAGFGKGGKVNTYFVSDTSNEYDEGLSIALQADGKIVMTGHLSLFDNNSYPIGIIRYNTNGSLDNTFGNGGKVLSTFPNLNGFDTQAITLQQDGKIIVTGGTSLDSIAKAIIFIARFKANGSIDSTWGSNGIVLTSIDTTFSYAYSTAMQTDGRIVVAGASDPHGMLVLRYLSGLNTGVLDFSSPKKPLLIYPNPIQTVTALQYTLTQSENISLSLFDMQGRQVQTFFTNQPRTPGEHKEELHLANTLAAGNYILSISNGQSSQGVKVTVVR